MNVNVNPADGIRSNTEHPLEWPEGALTRVPFWIYQSQNIYALEQQRMFEGPTWNFSASKPTSPSRATTARRSSAPCRSWWRATDDEINAFENRCAHRGALIASTTAASAKRLPVRLPRLELRPAGQPASDRLRARRQRQGRHARRLLRAEHGPRKLRITTFCGLVFGTLSADAPPIEEYLGPRGRRAASSAC